MASVEYWLKGSSELNFGDYLSEYFLNHLFLETVRRPVEVRIIGSVLHDSLFPAAAIAQGQEASGDLNTAALTNRAERLIAWGCGIREPGGLSKLHHHFTQFLSVRGPVSAIDLGLDPDIPQGDPAFVLPAIYQPRPHGEFANKAICIPHFFDHRSDEELLVQSQCEIVLRTNMPYGERYIERFIDAIVSSRFVLSASLHGAVVAAAYGRPFAFWNPGVIDVPIKWVDLAASMGIPDDFVASLPSGIDHYHSCIAPQLRLPSLWRALASAPYPLRPEAILKVLRYELGPIEDADLEYALVSRIAVFEGQCDHFSGIAAEGRDEVARMAEQVEHLNMSLVRLQRDLDLRGSRETALVAELDVAKRTIALLQQRLPD